MERLNFVSQWNERELPNAALEPIIAEHQAKLDTAIAEAKTLREQAGEEAKWSDVQKSYIAAADKQVEQLKASQPALSKVMAADEGPVQLVSLHVRGSHLNVTGEPLLNRDDGKPLPFNKPRIQFAQTGNLL